LAPVEGRPGPSKVGWGELRVPPPSTSAVAAGGLQGKACRWRPDVTSQPPGRVLPEKPDLVFAAALELYPDAEEGGPKGSDPAHPRGAGAAAEEGRPNVVDPAHWCPDH
jgi:hypothetical protein